MQELDVKTITKDNYSICIKGEDIILTGSIDSSEPWVVLEPFFLQLHKEAIEKHIKEIYIDVSTLDFINSSGIGQIIIWLLNIQKLSKKQRYKVSFIYNPKQAWQVFTFDALALINPELFNIKIRSI